jgi:hypothetical protein
VSNIIGFAIAVVIGVAIFAGAVAFLGNAVDVAGQYHEERR